MRITSKLAAMQLAGHLHTLRRQMTDLETEVSTGMRLQTVSDDPTATLSAMRMHSALRDLQQLEANQSDASSWLSDTEGALARFTEGLMRARDLAVLGANGTHSQGSLYALAREAESISEDLLALGNSQHLGKAMFAGFQTGLQPFSAAVPPGPRYTGDGGEMVRNVGPGIAIAVNLPGDRLLANGDFFTTLTNLANELQAGNNQALNAKVAELDSALDNISTLRTEVGARLKRLEQLEQWNVDARINYSAVLEKAEGTDMERALLDLNQADTAYRAALQVGGRILPQTLVDFLR